MIIFYYYLIEELNHSFNQKGFWHLTDEGNAFLSIIEHDNGSKIEISDESVDGSAKVTLVIVYPNNRSKMIGTFYQKELTDIADKMYEYSVVKNPIKQEGVNTMIRRKRNFYESHWLDRNSPLVKKYSDAVLDINKFNLQLRDAMFGMKEIINDTEWNPNPTYGKKTYEEWEDLAREAIDVIRGCANDCLEVLAGYNAVLRHNQESD